MTFHKIFEFFRLGAVVLATTLAVSPCLHAQAPLLSADVESPAPFIEAPTPAVTTPSVADNTHRFWDKQNWALLFSAAALNGVDFAVTRANLQSGGQELNPVVRLFGRSTPGLAVNFIGETVGVVSLSYFFHKTEHHKLERIVSMVNIGTSAAAVSYSTTHR